MKNELKEFNTLMYKSISQFDDMIYHNPSKTYNYTGNKGDNYISLGACSLKRFKDRPYHMLDYKLTNINKYDFINEVQKVFSKKYIVTYRDNYIVFTNLKYILDRYDTFETYQPQKCDCPTCTCDKTFVCRYIPEETYKLLSKYYEGIDIFKVYNKL